MYLPREDSYLLEEEIHKLKPKGIVIEVGVGSAIQCIAAAKTAKKVIGLEKDPKAINYSNSRVPKNVELRLSSYFSNCKETADLIICNPPYLPNDPRIKDMALDGGQEGWEWTDNFLRLAKNYLKPKGQILLLISSLTGQKKIEELFLKYGYIGKVIATKNLFGETLYVYLIDNSEWKFLDEGKRNFVLINKNLVKKINKQGKQNNLLFESDMLKTINAKGIGPKLVSYDSELIMKYVRGYDYNSWIKKGKLANFPYIIENLLEQTRILDSLQIDKTEFTRPYSNIKILGKKVTLLDFERARKSLKPKNVLQFCSFLANKLNIDLTKEAKNYSKTYSQKDFEILKNKIMKKVSFRKEYFIVWELLRKVPKGKTITYKELGDKAGIKSYRFIGRIMNQNPFAPIIPCHRVLSSNGIGGYAHGVEEKKKLLKKEGVNI